MLKKSITVLTLTALIGSSAPALSAMRPHKGLVEALKANGVNVQAELRTGGCDGIMGFYRPEDRLLVVCQPPEGWTEQQNVVLRHETIHAIQHCRNGLDNMSWFGNLNYWAEQGRARGFNLMSALAPYFFQRAPIEEINLEAEAWSRQETPEADLIAELNSACQES